MLDELCRSTVYRSDTDWSPPWSSRRHRSPALLSAQQALLLGQELLRLVFHEEFHFQVNEQDTPTALFASFFHKREAARRFHGNPDSFRDHRNELYIREGFLLANGFRL